MGGGTLALLLPLATLGDIVGYRRVYLVGMAVFAAASVACSLADSLGTLALARVVQGLGAAGIMSVNAALVRLIYPARLLGRPPSPSLSLMSSPTNKGASSFRCALSSRVRFFSLEAHRGHRWQEECKQATILQFQ